MKRFLVLLITLGGLWGSIWFSGDSIGISSQCVNGQCFVNASTSIGSIIIGALIAAFVIKLPRGSRGDIEKRAGFWRRLSSFYLDFAVVLITLTPILVLPALLVEYIHTGNFSWVFQRDYSRDSDFWIVFPNVVLLLLALIYYFYYFYYYALNSKPTLGQFVLGYRIVSTEGTMNSSIAIKRVLLSMLGMCLWPFAIVHGLIKKRVFWWDSGSSSMAVNKSSNADGENAAGS